MMIDKIVQRGKEKLLAGAAEMGIAMPETAADKLISYFQMLAEANKHMNLTAIDDLDGVITRHFLDSLAPLTVPETAGRLLQSGRTLIDIGTGAGFPGLPLALLLPDLHVTLLDSLQKRVAFLRQVIDALGVVNAEAVCGRAEDYARTPGKREKFDFATSRAVANLSVLAEYALPFVKVGGLFVAHKGKNATEELEGAEHALAVLGAEATAAHYVVPGSDADPILLLIHKQAKTPEKYPRRAGIPAKRPL